MHDSMAIATAIPASVGTYHLAVDQWLPCHSLKLQSPIQKAKIVK